MCVYVCVCVCVCVYVYERVVQEYRPYPLSDADQDEKREPRNSVDLPHPTFFFEANGNYGAVDEGLDRDSKPGDVLFFY